MYERSTVQYKHNKCAWKKNEGIRLRFVSFHIEEHLNAWYNSSGWNISSSIPSLK